MVLSTRFTELVGCPVPIQQAGMAAAAPPQLAAAVSSAGGLGMIGAGRAGVTPETLAQLVDTTRALTSQVFGVNFIYREPASPDEYALYEVAARGARVVELFL